MKEGPRFDPTESIQKAELLLATNSSDCFAEDVSFHNFAGRTGLQFISKVTSPWHCESTANAVIKFLLTVFCLQASSKASTKASHQAIGFCSLIGGCVAGWGA